MFSAHLRFDDRRYAGRSEYRPGEGWIDVTDYGYRYGQILAQCSASPQIFKA